MAKYVCAFRGRRDSYQVPLALADADLLDQFITDAYALRWMRFAARLLPEKTRQKFLTRSDSGLPDGRIKCLWKTTILEHLRHQLGYSPAGTYAWLDQWFSREAAARATQSRSHLFLYSPYAWEAFTARYQHNPNKILFQFHPHCDLENRILADDLKEYPFLSLNFEEETGARLPEFLQRRSNDAWRYSDLVVCASSFSRKSLQECGASGDLCRVVPYGVQMPIEGEKVNPPDGFRVLFVGSGIQRKGLHHLLLAWSKASLPAGSKLTLVCRVIDQGIEALAAKTDGVELMRGVPQGILGTLYRDSALFAMPSLVEGFGQVYLEALAQGCPVLGTANSCLPDLGNEMDGIFLCQAGNIDDLVGKLEITAALLLGDKTIRQRAKACASRFSWSRFRRELLRHIPS